MLQIKLLGECSLVYNHQPVSGISTDRLKALLAYLVLHHHAPQSRQRLAFHLWANSSDTQARSNLRKELSYLRRSLPDPDHFLLVDAKTLQWQLEPDCWVDVVAFESLIKQAEQSTDPTSERSLLEEALSIYRGDLVPDCEDEWISPERHRLQQMRLRALSLLVDRLEQQRDYRRAIAHAQQWLRLDPLSEVTYCTLMRLYGCSGDRSNALQLYHQCMTVLRDELGVDPSPTTRKLYEQLLRDDELPPERSALSPLPTSESTGKRAKTSHLPLIGRDREWQIIQQWMACNASDRSILLVVGEPGIGKTRLLQEVQETLPGDRSYQLWGRGFEAEIVRPYGVWIDALRSLAAQSNLPLPAELGFLLPEAGTPVEVPTDRSRLFDIVVQFLSRLCSQQHSLWIVLDDIQWIDEASSALLHYASRLLSSLPIWFACTARTKELDENAAVLKVTQALRREHRLLTLELCPLAPAQTTELVRQATQATTSQTEADWQQTADRIFVESGGNPLFALEIARAMVQGDTAHADNLELLIRDRLQRLDESARELIPWAAALGQSFKPTLVAHVADYPLAKLLLAVEQLERESIIRTSASYSDEIYYDFAHDIVRQVAYRQLSEPRRRLIHLQIAHQLNRLTATDPALAADIAHHAALGGDRALAATCSLTAAERSLKMFAYAEAAELAQRGIQHCQFLDDRTRIHLHLQLLRTAVLAGILPEQSAALEADVQQLIVQAQQLGMSEAQATGFEALMFLHFASSDFTGMHQTSLRAVEASRTANPTTTARMLAASGSCLAEMGREMIRAEVLLLEAQSLAARIGLESTDIPCGLGCVQRHNGNYDEARTLLQRSWRLAQAGQDHWRECNSLGYLAMTELDAGNPAAALPYCQEMATVARQMKGEGSEGAIAFALEALANYRLQPNTNLTQANLEKAILTLCQADAKRTLAYILVGAAEVDLGSDRPTLAMQRAELALNTAQSVNQPSELALAWVLLIQSAWTCETDRDDPKQAQIWYDTWKEQIDRPALSWRARVAIHQVHQAMQTLLSVGRA